MTTNTLTLLPAETQTQPSETTTQVAQVVTALGAFRAVVDDGVVRSASFLVGPDRGPQHDRWGVHDVLAAYFAGDVDALDSLAVRADGTPFQQSVWKELRLVRAGETASYGEIAERIGSPTAARAVGMANATNPIALIVPCHRIVRTGGALGGYYYGVETKRWLLDHEATHRPVRGVRKDAGRDAFSGQSSQLPWSA